jgi:acetyl-CoA carboxylase biotin carboxyl carrier protein
MSDAQDPLEQVKRAAAELIPELTARLALHGLGEIEVRDGELRVRIARALPAPGSAAPHGSTTDASGAAERLALAPAASAAHGVTSPAVGFFIYADGLGPGLPVDKGDELGHVEMLGVRHDVRAPRRGTVRNLVTETGEAVEYGQLLIEMEAAE